MIVEVALAVAASAALVTALRARSRARPKTSAPAPRLAGELRRGDVLVHRGQERFLAALLALREGRWSARLFGVMGTEVEFVLAMDGALYLLRTAELPAAPLPIQLVVAQRHLSRVRHAKVAVTKLDPEGILPRFLEGGTAMWSAYVDVGGRAAVALELGGARLALLGERLEEPEFDILPGPE
jgi:hypothetical protein